MGFLSSLADATPGVGTVKSLYHYARGEEEKGDEAMYQSTRTSAVLVGGIFGGPLGAMGAGAATDAAASGLMKKEKGFIKSCKNISDDIDADRSPLGSMLGMGFQLGTDAICGYGGGGTAKNVGKASQTAFKKTVQKGGEEMIEKSVKISASEAAKMFGRKTSEKAAGRIATRVAGRAAAHVGLSAQRTYLEKRMRSETESEEESEDEERKWYDQESDEEKRQWYDQESDEEERKWYDQESDEEESEWDRTMNKWREQKQRENEAQEWNRLMREWMEELEYQRRQEQRAKELRDKNEQEQRAKELRNKNEQEQQRRQKEQRQSKKQEEDRKREQRATNEKQQNATAGSNSGSGQPPQGNKNNNNKKRKGKNNEPTYFEAFVALMKKILKMVYGNASEPFTSIIDNLTKQERDYLLKILKPIRRFGALELVVELVVKTFKQHFSKDVSYLNFISMLEFVQVYVSDEHGARTLLSSGTETPETEMDPEERKPIILAEISNEKHHVEKLTTVFHNIKNAIKFETTVWNSAFPYFRDIFAAVYHYFKHKKCPEKGRIMSVREYLDWIRKYLGDLLLIDKFTELKKSDGDDFVHEVFEPIFRRRFKVVIKTHEGKSVLSSAYVVDGVHADDKEKHAFVVVSDAMTLLFMSICLCFVCTNVFLYAPIVLFNTLLMAFNFVASIVTMLLNILLFLVALFFFILKVVLNIVLLFAFFWFLLFYVPKQK